MKSVLHRADTRGHANHGWLNSHHTFSFAGYHNPERMNFGLLRVLNDDNVAGGMGFGKHPHDNMEIVSIPLSGDLEHEDSMGNKAIIRQNDVQIMSAGTGVVHSEKNHNSKTPVKFLQIWIFPKVENIEPRYEQKTFSPGERVNKFQEVISPAKGGEGLWINQDAWFQLGSFKKGVSVKYKLHQKDGGVYIFVLDGSVTLGDQTLSQRDGLGIWEAELIELTATEDTNVLLMEVPMA